MDDIVDKLETLAKSPNLTNQERLFALEGAGAIQTLREDLDKARRGNNLNNSHYYDKQQ